MKMILDVDTGIDDALAIAYALGSEEAQLIGVTCCFGNVTVDKAVQNMLRVLRLFGPVKYLFMQEHLRCLREKNSFRTRSANAFTG